MVVAPGQEAAPRGGAESRGLHVRVAKSFVSETVERARGQLQHRPRDGRSPLADHEHVVVMEREAIKMVDVLHNNRTNASAADDTTASNTMASDTMAKEVAKADAKK